MSKFDAKTNLRFGRADVTRPCSAKFKRYGDDVARKFLYKYCKTHDKVATNIILAVYFLFALGIFIVPSNIFSRYEICREFVNFMKQYFPNIQIFSDVSPFKEDIEFYTSYMWVIGLILAVKLAFYVTCQYITFVDEDANAKENIKKHQLFWIAVLFWSRGIWY